MNHKRTCRPCIQKGEVDPVIWTVLPLCLKLIVPTFTPMRFAYKLTPRAHNQRRGDLLH